MPLKNLLKEREYACPPGGARHLGLGNPWRGLCLVTSFDHTLTP